MHINLLTVCTDKYPVQYAEKLIKRVTSLSKYDIKPYCITDRPDLVKTFATPIEPPKGITGWWHKPLVFNPDGPSGWNLYMDLDIVVCQNFDYEIEHVLKTDPEGEYIHAVSDAICWLGNKFSSSWMMFKTGQHGYIYNQFMESPKTAQTYRGGDQVWIGKVIKPKVKYIDETFPDLKKNLKFHLSNKVFGEWQLPDWILPTVKMVDCGGKPKPHELVHLDYIKRNWHDI